MKKVYSFFMILAITISVIVSFPVTVSAATSGITGDCTWALDGTVLTISGNGAMEDYSSLSVLPWGTSISEVVIGTGVTAIGDYAFYKCSYLEAITLSNSVNSIGVSAFDSCGALTSIILPDSVLVLGSGSFCRCLNLKSVVIGDGVEEIYHDTFYECEKLESVTLSKSITYIDTYAFYHCYELKDVWYRGSVDDSYGIYIGENSMYSYIRNAEWHYDICKVHTYTNGCDATCENCSVIRTVPDHIYENNCDTTCNSCGVIRNVPDHVYENTCDTSCNICGTTRTISGHKYNNSCDTTCNICNASRTITHTYDNACDTGCSICGITRTVSSHKYTNNCDTTCDICNASRIITHTYDNVCDITCNICGATRSVTHSYGAYVYNDDATCDKDGTKTRSCSVCGKKETVTAAGTKLTDSSKLFADVSVGAWYKPYIDYAVTYKLLNGTGNGMAPDRTMTRAEFVQVLANIAGVDTSKSNVNAGFTDVAAGQWFAPAVKWASENGIVYGVSPTEFAPNNKISREQMCTMLVRYIENHLKITLEQKNAKKTFADDAKISSWAKEPVYQCQMSGLVGGVSPTEFDPAAEANRASVATIMARFHQQYIN